MTNPALRVVLMLGVALAMPIAHAAAAKIPAKFLGKWCSENSQTYRRGHSRFRS
jgi:hypothetical protein